MFLTPALAHDSDYTIHIDEDCFLFDPTQIDRLIRKMDQQEEVVLAGVPDGGNYYREHNPYACNLFFLVFKTKAIRDLLHANPNWRSYKFQNHFETNSDLDLSELDKSRIQLDDYESYYPFFWAILGGQNRILDLQSKVDSALLSTDVSFGGTNGPMARHMWYLRSWDAAELGPHDKIPHRQRYEMLEREILDSFGTNPEFCQALREQNRTRSLKGAFRKVSRSYGRLTSQLQKRAIRTS